jgi:myo-inositol-1-phosphate synthase
MRKNNKNLAAQIINRFGGQSRLAALLGKRQSTVQHWARTGRIPAQWHQPLMSLAREKGIILEAKDFTSTRSQSIEPAEGRLGILLVGLGAVATTFIAGVEHARRGSGPLVGSLTQIGRIRLGKRTQDRRPRWRASTRWSSAPGTPIRTTPTRPQ